jgi:predicted NBD/HSP70 family sugar kinase
MNWTVGVDVGGSKAAAVLLDDSGAERFRLWTEHGPAAPGGLAGTVRTAVTALLDEAGVAPGELAACGVAVAGLVGADRSTVVHAAVLGERRLDLGAALGAELGVPAVVVNDAAATLHGHLHGGGTTAESPAVAVLLTLGTGVGGAVAVGGEVVDGDHGFAAELGHLTVDYEDQRVCLCGSRGCLEQFACGRGVAELAIVTPPPPGTRESLERLDLRGAIGSRHVVALAADGDAWATGVLDRCGAMLGRAVAQLCTTLDPGAVVIGGSFGHTAQRWLLPAAAAEMRLRWPFSGERPPPPVAVDSIGPYAAAVGAGLIALRRDAS